MIMKYILIIITLSSCSKSINYTLQEDHILTCDEYKIDNCTVHEHDSLRVERWVK